MTRAFAPYPFTPAVHPPRLPPMKDGVDTSPHPVAIVGGGPVGLMAAIGLAVQGVRCVLIEADEGVCTGSRAICISRRSLQIAQRLGALPGFLELGLPWTGGRSFYRNTEVLQFQMPTDDMQKLPPMVNLAQYHIEEILLQRAEALADRIDIRWQTRVTGLDTAREDGVRLSLSTPAGDYALDAAWVVAADGGRSGVRESLGLSLQGTSYEGRYVIVDILLDSDRPTERLAYFDPPCNPGSTVLVHKQPRGVWRIDYQLREGEDPDEAVKPEQVMPRVESLLAMMGETGAWQPVWITLYKAHALTLPSYRQGRVFLAGDAAHLVPIFGVRGANSGIDDADNLAWKLGQVVRGVADEALLDSYSVERVAAAHENLACGTKSTEFMAPPSFAFELMRTAVLGLAARHPAVRPLINPRQTSAIAYVDSPLNGPSDGFEAGPPPGHVVCECPLADGHLTDRLGTGYTALYFGEARDAPSCDCELQALPRALDVSGRLYPLYGADDGSLYLIRPDGHVLARWRDGRRADVDAALASARRGGDRS
jgi:3-(3-hydroxy-phenyl)propionate hydroxylase